MEPKAIMKKALDELLSNEIDEKKILSIIKELESNGCTWRNLGDIENNHARVNIVANPEPTMVERITNAMDAVLEKYATTNSNILSATSPREAVKKIQDDISAEVEVTVNVRDKMNLFVRDKGIGLTSAEMPKTILALNESNKFRKSYLIGQYGQGGSTTCAFSKYTVIISKKYNSTDEVAFSILRFNTLEEDQQAKDGKFEYLVMNYLPPTATCDNSAFPPGTLVVLINYQSGVPKGFINYYQVFDHYLFDPPLPYSLYYEPKEQGGGRRNLSGARRRIESSKLKQHQNEFTHIVEENSDFGDIRIRYWLLKKTEEKKDKNGKVFQENVQADKFLRDHKNPILITYNGQVQGMMARTILKDNCKFGYIYKSLIIQIDCDGLKPSGKKYFFTSGRDRLKTPAEKAITDALTTLLTDDKVLTKENETREQESITEDIGKDTVEIRKKLAEMLNQLNPGKFKVSMGDSQKSKEGDGHQSSENGEEPLAPPPLPTKEEPTYVSIVNKKKPITIQKGRTCRLRIESDAPNNLLKNEEWKLELGGAAPLSLRIHSYSDFEGGRCSIYIKSEDSVAVGDKFSITIQLQNQTKGKIIASNQREIEIVEPRQSDSSNKIEINAPLIVALTDKDVKYSEFGWDERTVAEVKEGTQNTVFVNMSNTYLIQMLQKGRYADARLTRIKNQYMLHIAFHAFIQHLGFKNSDISLEEGIEDKVIYNELDRVSRTVCTTLMAMPQESA